MTEGKIAVLTHLKCSKAAGFIHSTPLRMGAKHIAQDFAQSNEFQRTNISR